MSNDLKYADTSALQAQLTGIEEDLDALRDECIESVGIHAPECDYVGDDLVGRTHAILAELRNRSDVTCYWCRQGIVWDKKHGWLHRGQPRVIPGQSEVCGVAYPGGKEIDHA
ncbi:MAG: hypothetical protein KDJ65_01485 [Anaerolineae bacterium]|nr:hypothetical protein [Anaerolineae bacterium]